MGDRREFEVSERVVGSIFLPEKVLRTLQSLRDLREQVRRNKRGQMSLIKIRKKERGDGLKTRLAKLAQDVQTKITEASIRAEKSALLSTSMLGNNQQHVDAQ